MSRNHQLLSFLAAVVFLACMSIGSELPSADARGEGNGPPVTVMTRNLYLGADVSPIFGAAQAGSFADVVAATTQAYATATASDMPARAAAIGDEIRKSRPHLVGVQEAAVWTSIEDPASPVSVSILDLLIRDLNADGERYEVVVTQKGFDMALPTALGYPVNLTMSDAILARSDLADTAFSVDNPASGNYAARIQIPLETPDGAQVVEIPRQWAAVDVTTDGKSFRFITTHLESAVEDIRVFQASELLDVTNDSGFPLVVVGDLNSEASDAGDASWLLTQYGGLDDAWAAKRPKASEKGNTCCQDPSLRVPESTLVKRIDFVLTRGAFRIVNASVVGDEPIASPSTSGSPVLWASDHAGVTTKLLVPKGSQ